MKNAIIDSQQKTDVFATAAALCAFAALAISANAAWLPVVACVSIIASCLIGARCSESASGVNVWRGFFLLIAGGLFWSDYTSENGGTPEVLLAWAIARVAAAEYALRSWMRDGWKGERRALQLLLPALVVMGASNTFETAWVRGFVPLWLGCALLSLRSTVEIDRTLVKQSRRIGGLRLLAVCLVLVCGFALHVTVLVNRYQIAQVGAKLLGERMVGEAVGLSTRPRLGATFGAEGSLTRVLRIENLPGDVAYFRAMSFDVYEGGAWLSAPDSRSFRDIAARELEAKQAPSKTARVQRLIDDDGLVFAPLHSAGILVPDAQLQWARGGPLRTQDPAPDPLFYDIALSEKVETQGPLAEVPTPTELQKLQRVPDEIPFEARLLAQGIAGGLEPRAQIRAIETYLQKNHAYSLSTDPGEGDPVANFLQSDKAAHCEYFASAAVMMLRSVGVPARYCIGYYVHEKDGDATIVRLRDAHAWAEAFVNGAWVNVEATPGGARPDKRGEPVPFWRKLRERIQDITMALRLFAAGLANADRRLLVLGLVCFSAAVAGAMWLARRSKQTQTREFRYSTRDAELSALGRRFERWLQHTLPIEARTAWHAQTWHELARHNPRLLEDNATAREWLARYNAARFGRTTSDETARLKQLLRVLESQKKTKVRSKKEEL
ncbi:MAG TPA: transglutaminase-like domain-containing protein [Abditibacteriaceae bacterium]